jgi:hypothetical protein
LGHGRYTMLSLDNKGPVPSCPVIDPSENKLQRLEFLPLQVKQTSEEKQTRARVKKSNKLGRKHKAEPEQVRHSVGLFHLLALQSAQPPTSFLKCASSQEILICK